MTSPRHVAHMLEAGSTEDLLPIVYTRLDALVRVRVRHGQPLRPYRLVHRLWLEMLHEAEERWRWRGPLLAQAARPVLRLLVHHARRLQPEGRTLQVELVGWPLRGACVDVVEFDAALVRLAMQDELRARLIELRDLAGLAVDETATELDVTPDTVLREWSWARTGLLRDLGAIAAAPVATPHDIAAGTSGIRR